MSATETVTIKRISKRDFEVAFNAGDRVAVIKDPNYWKFYDNSIGSVHEVPGPVGFTNASVRLEDVYADGPSRPGEAFRFFLVDGLEDPQPWVDQDGYRWSSKKKAGYLSRGPSTFVFTYAPRSPERLRFIAQGLGEVCHHEDCPGRVPAGAEDCGNHEEWMT